MNIIKIFFVLCLIAFTTNSIGKEIYTPADYFYDKHPEIKDKYFELVPTSFEDLVEPIEREYAAQKRLIRKLYNKFGHIEELFLFLEVWEKRIDLQHSQNIEILTEFKKSITKEDYFYKFKYDDGKRQEAGLLILNNGDIKMRDVYHTTLPKK